MVTTVLGVVGCRVEGRTLRQRKQCLRSLEESDLGHSVRAARRRCRTLEESNKTEEVTEARSFWAL